MAVEKETVFKLTQDQKKQLDDKLQELLELCQIFRVPMFASCAVVNENKETEYINIVYSAQSHAIRLYDDKIRKHLLLANENFDVVPKREIVAFDPLGAFSHE